MPDWIHVGLHRYRHDGDLIYVELHGDLGVEELRQLWDVAEAAEDAYGYVISVFDARKSNGVTPQARKYVGERNRKRALIGPVVMLGANIVVRTIARLLYQATLLMGKNPAPLFFCDTPHDLPQLLAEQRQAFAHVKKRPP